LAQPFKLICASHSVHDRSSTFHTYSASKGIAPVS
jgi:hypothetical protein